jgi:hypothetical protein
LGAAHGGAACCTQVTDGQGNPLDFSKGRYLELKGYQQCIIAAPPAVHAALVASLRSINEASATN